MKSLCMQRKSIRKFKEDPVSETMERALLESAMQAPSATNQQPWEFIVIRHKGILKELSSVSKGAWPLKGAPFCIVSLMRETGRKSNMRPQDMGASTENILLEATYQGLGGVWIGVYPEEDRIAKIKSILDIDDKLTPFNMIAIGVPEASENTPITRRFDETRIKRID